MIYAEFEFRQDNRGTRLHFFLKKSIMETKMAALPLLCLCSQNWLKHDEEVV